MIALASPADPRDGFEVVPDPAAAPADVDRITGRTLRFDWHSVLRALSHRQTSAGQEAPSR